MLTISLCLLTLLSCGGASSNGNKTEDTNATKQKRERVRLIDRITSPSSKDIFKQGDNIDLKFSASSKYDSALVLIDGNRVDIELDGDSGVITSSEEWTVGKRKLEVKLYKDGASQSKSISFSMVPSKAPLHYKAKIVRSIPHSKQAYTQGFEFSEGKLLESSGQYGISYLAELEFPSMKELRRVNLDPKLFAEGVTVLDDKIYLITWREGVGLIYDRKTMKQVGEWSYATEGWGLTNDGENLYMSDGSEYIYIVDLKTMKNISRLEVTSAKGAVKYINELEWIDGKIWANLYGANMIAIINPKTGAIEAVVDCSELRDRVSGEVDVLNGIARDSKTGKIYLTGKLWPNTFEIELISTK